MLSPSISTKSKEKWSCAAISCRPVSYCRDEPLPLSPITANFSESFRFGSVISRSTSSLAVRRNGRATVASAAARNVRRFIASSIAPSGETVSARRLCFDGRAGVVAGLRRAPVVHRRDPMDAADRAERRACLRRHERALDVFGCVLFERRAGIAALLRAVVHEAV